MNIFNRKEVLDCFSMEKCIKARQVLNENNIKYYVKTINRNSPSVFSDTRSRTGTFGQNLSISYEYIIYVKKCDYINAKYFLSNIDL